MFKAPICRLVTLALLATDSSASAASLAKTDDGYRLKLDLQIASSNLEELYKGEGTFKIARKAIGPSANLQVIGRVNSTAILADIAPGGDSGNIFWIKVMLMDLNKAQLTETLSTQIGFIDSFAGESNAVNVKVNSIIFSKSIRPEKTKEEPFKLEMKLRLHQ